MEAFAQNSNFSFVVGSDADNWKWYHRWYSNIDWRVPFLPEWKPAIDKTLLEIYLTHSPVGHYNHWYVLRPGDWIDKNGTVTRGSNMDTSI